MNTIIKKQNGACKLRALLDASFFRVNNITDAVYIIYEDTGNILEIAELFPEDAVDYLELGDRFYFHE